MSTNQERQLQLQVTKLKNELATSQHLLDKARVNKLQYSTIAAVLTPADIEVITKVISTVKKRHPQLKTSAISRGVVSCAIAAKAHRVPLKQSVALALVESTFNVLAVSRANCKGLTQLSTLVWRSYAPRYGMDMFSVFNPVANAVVGVGYLKELTRSHSGNIHRALVFYNGGSSGANSCHRYAAKVLQVAAEL